MRIAALVMLVGCHGDKDTSSPGLEDNFGAIEDEGTPGCDNLLPACLYPFPSDAYLGEDGHVQLTEHAFSPQATFDPAPLSGNYGFGSASPILFQLPGAVPPSSAPFDSEPSMIAASQTILIDAATGERIPHWVETDFLSPDLDPPLLVIRPAVPLPRGSEVVVGVRGLVDAAGAPVEAPLPFQALRDRTESRWIGIHDRRDHFESVVFPALEQAGVGREELQLAWSFHIQEDELATAPLLSIRDAIFAALPASGPSYTLDTLTVCDGGGDDSPECHPSIRVIVDGTVSVPSVMLPPDAQGVRRLRLAPDGSPVVEGFEQWPFRLQLPNSAFVGDTPVPILQYGHGFLGSASEANNGWLREMADRLGFGIIACDMQGMSEDITEVWLGVLSQGSRFPELQELALQGIVNQLVQQRLVASSLSQDIDARLHREDGQLAWDPSVIWYYGNSQGGSVGTLVVATSLDVKRGVLGVPGSGYPLLLHRSIDFSPFASLFRVVYPAEDSIAAFLAILGTGWDYSDPLTFAPHLSGDPLPGTPDHEVLYHVAKEDRQVLNEASFISARAAGASLMIPAVRPVYGLPEATYPSSLGAALVEVDFGVPDDPTPLDPPDGDPSLPDEGDTHGWLRQWPPAQDQLVHFLRTGEIIDVCGGIPCVTGPPEE